MRKLVFVVLVLLIAFVCPADASWQMSLVPDRQQYQIGDTGWIAVMLRTDQPISVLDFEIRYNKAIMHDLAFDLTGTVFPFVPTQTADHYQCGIPGQSGFVGNGLITKLKFKCVGLGYSWVNLHNPFAMYYLDRVEGNLEPSTANFTVVSVPEQSSLVALVGGLSSFTLLRKRKN